MILLSPYAVISSLETRWEEFKNSPSRKDKISEEMEHYLRASGCRFIIECSKILKLQNIVPCTACVYFQLFYLRESFKSNEINMDRYNFSTACLYLAAKTLEDRRLINDVIHALYVQKNIKRNIKNPPRLDEKKRIHMVNALKDAELKITQTIEFEFDINLPHIIFSKYGLNLCKDLHLSDNNFKTLVRKTMFLLNHSLHSIVCLFYPPSFVCCACMQLAFNMYNIMNKRKVNPKLNWQKKIDQQNDQELKLKVLEYIADEVLSVVDEPLREGLFCDRNHHKLPQEEAIAYIEQNKNIKQTHSISKKKMYFGVDRPELSPLTYPTPSPYSKSASIEEWTLYLGDLKRNCSEKTIRKVKKIF